MRRLLFIISIIVGQVAVGLAQSSVNSQAVGTIRIACSNNNVWRLKPSMTKADGVELLTLDFTADAPAAPARTEVEFSLPQKDIYQLWTAGSDNTHLSPNWMAYYESSLASNMPLYTLMNNNDGNRLTIAADEVKRLVKMNLGLREEGAVIYCRMTLFDQPEAPLDSYRVVLRLDNRPCFWADAAREAADWMTRSAGIKPCFVPDDAFAPLYSSWYQFHQDVSDKAIEAECKEAKALGMKTIIVDDGWQTDDNNRGYAYCGDWQVSKRRFSNFASHIKKVHKMGMKYMLWYSVPWMGAKSKNYKRFEGKYLYYDGGQQAAALDPRFPEVRKYLVDTYVKAMDEWGLDGFKLDFIDSFHFRGEDPAIRENYAGRDIKSLPEAVNVLMKEVYDALSAKNPAVMIEFRQSYIGPAIRQYGNMMRAGDCPANPQDNRIRIAKLRLTSGNTAVHSDMLEWHVDEESENVALSIMNAMFGVVQYSAMLRDIPEDHKKVVGTFIRFTQDHKEALLHGQFLPHHPELCYPVVEGRSATENVIGIYSDGLLVDVDPAPSVYLMNATGRDFVSLRLVEKPKKTIVYNCYGKKVRTVSVKKGLAEISVPRGGYVEMRF